MSKERKKFRPRTIWLKLKHQISDAKWWVRHRTIDRYDVVRLQEINPGYHEPETRMFYSLMQILCDFVEVELAWHDYWCSPKEERGPKPKKRDRERGLKHLDWEISLIADERYGVYPGAPGYGLPTAQSTSAAEVKAIYLWYRDVFQKRPNPYDLYDKMAYTREWALHIHALEEKYHAEDEEYMKRLIAVRRSMWT